MSGRKAKRMRYRWGAELPDRDDEEPEARPMCACNRCKSTIYEGERWFKLDGDYYCTDCVKKEELEFFEPIYCSECERFFELDEEYYVIEGGTYCKECVRTGDTNPN